MLAQLLSPDYIVFAGAFVLMIGIGLIEAVGLGIGHFDLHADIGHGDIGDIDGPALLDWLGLGRGLPILVWLTAFLACFTLAGLILQQCAGLVLGAPLHWTLAAGAAAVIGLVANGFVSRLFAGIFPAYESTIIDSAELLRHRATILEGTARRGAPARAKVIDYHGQAHYVMVEPHEDDGIVTAGETGLLVRKEGLIFFVLPESATSLTSI